MIRSSKTTLRFANANKREALEGIMREYHRVVCAFVDILWEKPHAEVRSLLDKEITSAVPTFLSARLIQCAGKQASGVVRGTRQKREQRMYQHKKLADEGKHKHARKLMASILRYDVSKPNMKFGLPMELDERFCSIELEVGSKKFDGWLSLASLGLKEKIKIPFKRTKHFNELLSLGTLKKGVRLSSRNITFMFEIPDPAHADHGKTAGIDIGMTTALSVSFGDHQWESQKCAHGHDLTTICQKISRRKKGSKGFRRAQQHRKNYINQQVNLMPLDGVRQINIEGIRDMRKGKRSTRFMSHFTYTVLSERLKSTSEERGVLVVEVDPAFTSQRCSCCGWTREANRKGKKFQCGKCGFIADADLNASRNLSLDLTPIVRTGKKRPDNKKGFYWRVLGPGKEPMSPLCSEISDHICIL
jgi:transposase